MAMTQNKDNISITFPNITYYTTSLIFYVFTGSFNIGPIIGTYKSTVIQYFPATYFYNGLL